MCNKPIYLDYAATTPIDSVVADAMQGCMTQDTIFGNPASNTHRYGFEAKEKVDDARLQVANCLGAEAREIIWTSGATESINLAIQGYAYANAHKGKHIITTQVEHKAVLDTCRFLETQGFSITYLKPDASGIIAINDLKQAISEETILLSVLWVNNETGVVQPLKDWVHVAQQYGIAVHVDAVQAIGKLPIKVHDQGIDLLSVSAHKAYGPKGVGALYVRRGKPKITLQPLIYGGGHESGLRSGTLPLHQIVGMGAAFDLISKRFEQDLLHLQALRRQFISGIQSLPRVTVNGSDEHSAPHVVNVQFNGVDGEALIMAMQDIAVSAGSACTSTTIEPSHVLSAMGLTASQAHSSVRFSFGRYTTQADIEVAIASVIRHVNRLRQLSPLWK